MIDYSVKSISTSFEHNNQNPIEKRKINANTNKNVVLVSADFGPSCGVVLTTEDHDSRELLTDREDVMMPINLHDRMTESV